jgi:hypothetical protein
MAEKNSMVTYRDEERERSRANPTNDPQASSIARRSLCHFCLLTFAF